MRSAERGMRNGSQSLVTSSPTLVACPHPQPLSHPMGRGGGEKLPQRLKQPPCCGRERPHSEAAPGMDARKEEEQQRGEQHGGGGAVFLEGPRGGGVQRVRGFG